MKITRVSERPSFSGPEDWFTGQVRVDMLFPAQDAGRASGGHVTFEPGARTAWHTHPIGQTLIVTSGSGYVQVWGQERRVIEPGDIVWIAAGEKHWHGASEKIAMTHIAIQEEVNGSPVEWLEQVSDEHYLG